MRDAVLSRYIDLPTSRAIQEKVALARQSRQPLLIVGPPGRGKTTALARYASTHLNTHLLTINGARRSLAALVNEISDAFENYGFEPSLQYKDRSLRRHLGDLMHFATVGGSSPPCLIVDEVQNLNADAIRYLLTFNDDFKMPIVIAGNRSAIKRTRSHASAFDQIEDRLLLRLDVGKVTENDITAAAVDLGVEGVDAFGLLIAYGSDASIRQTFALLDEARAFAGVGAGIRFEHVRDAIVSLQGPDVAKDAVGRARRRRQPAASEEAATLA